MRSSDQTGRGGKVMEAAAQPVRFYYFSILEINKYNQKRTLKHTHFVLTIYLSLEANTKFHRNDFEL